METSSIVFNSKRLSKVCIQYFSPFDIKSNVQLVKKKKTQDWRHNCEGWFYHRNFFWRIKFHWKSRYEYTVMCFIASFKKKLWKDHRIFPKQKKTKTKSTLILVQLLAIHKIGSTQQTFSQIISFLGGHFVGRID